VTGNIGTAAHFVIAVRRLRRSSALRDYPRPCSDIAGPQSMAVAIAS
jgi:hypothetical protein